MICDSKSIQIFRLIKECEELNLLPGVSAGKDNSSDYFNWTIAIDGPMETVYRGGLFFIKVAFPDDYPLSPPKLNFITPIYHPNISLNGDVHLNILTKFEWSFKNTIADVFKFLMHLIEHPNPYDPIEEDIAALYVSNKNQFIYNAMKHTQKYAM